MDRSALYELDLEEVPAPELAGESQEPLEAELDAALRVLETGDYGALTGKPSIEGVTLVGDRSFRELGLGEITDAEIDEIIFGEA